MRILTSLHDRNFFDAITNKLRQKLYPMGSHLVDDGDHIDKFLFILRGTLECKHRNGDIFLLGDGDVFGEELITWCIEQLSLGHYKGTFLTFSLLGVNLKFKNNVFLFYSGRYEQIPEKALNFGKDSLLSHKC